MSVKAMLHKTARAWLSGHPQRPVISLHLSLSQLLDHFAKTTLQTLVPHIPRFIGSIWKTIRCILVLPMVRTLQ